MESYFLPLLIAILKVTLLLSKNTENKTVVERNSTNVAILCNLDRQFNSLYWRINTLIFDQYSVPRIFQVVEHEALIISSVDRRMDGWHFQCFIVNPSREDNETPGLITVLTVIYDNNTMNNLPNADLLLQSANHDIPLRFHDSQVGPDITRLSWFPDANSTCIEQYSLDIYNRSEIDDATPESTLMPLHNTGTMDEETISISSSYIENYFRISALSSTNLTCAVSAYYYNIKNHGFEENIYVYGSTASIPISEVLRNNNITSLQLIWPKNEDTQCVCPLVKEFMSTCACNIQNTNNMVNISGNELVISNLTQELSLHVVYSVSSGCHGGCNLRSIAGVYRIMHENASILIDYKLDGDICFSINNFNHSFIEANLTDSTGSLTPLSGIYPNHECLSISQDLYPDMCGPFKLSVAALGSGEKSESIIFPNNSINQCFCYKTKENYDVRITSTNSISAELTLVCGYRRDNFAIMLTIFQTMPPYKFIAKFTASCDSVMVIPYLTASTNYSVNSTTTTLDEELTCFVQHFVTAGERCPFSLTIAVQVVISTICYHVCGLI